MLAAPVVASRSLAACWWWLADGPTRAAPSRVGLQLVWTERELGPSHPATTQKRCLPVRSDRKLLEELVTLMKKSHNEDWGLRHDVGQMVFGALP